MQCMYIYLYIVYILKRSEILCCSVNWTRKKIKELVFQSIISHSLSSRSQSSSNVVCVGNKKKFLVSFFLFWSSPDPIIIRFCEIATITARQCQLRAGAHNALVTGLHLHLFSDQHFFCLILHSFSRNSQTPFPKDEATTKTPKKMLHATLKRHF